MGDFLKVDILIAHPGKHHVLHLVAGCIKSGASVSYVTPFYRCGVGSLVDLLPGSVGSKAKGYFHPNIPPRSIVSPMIWQIRKLISFINNNLQYERGFDNYVARKIEEGRYKFKVLVTLQDYMPNTVRAAKRLGYIIWTDQISNQCDEMASRVIRHERALGLNIPWKHSEENNNEIIAVSNMITVPSTYCLDGIRQRIYPHNRVKIIPYGASKDQFELKHTDDPHRVVILARAQSLRKGGHLLLMALMQCGGALLELVKPKKIKVIILGRLEPLLCNLLAKLILPGGLSIEHGNVPHVKVGQLYQHASLFVVPSLSEGMSLACIEALHSGLPLIITSYCGIDGFKNGEMGYEIADTVESLANALVNAFNNQHQWQLWRMNAKYFSKDLTWDLYEANISQLARGLIS